MTGTPTGGRATAARLISQVTCATLLASLFLAGCDSAEQPGPTPTVVPSSSGLATPVPPASARTTAGVEAFITYFWAVVSYGQTTNDSAPLREIGGPDCTFCSAQFDNMSDRASRNVHYRGGEISAKDFVAPPGDPGDRPLLTMVLEQHPGDIVDADGVSVAVIEAVTSKRSDVLLAWSGSRWTVEGVSLGNPGE